jgi:hypothetical protein
MQVAGVVNDESHLKDARLLQRADTSTSVFLLTSRVLIRALECGTVVVVAERCDRDNSDVEREQPSLVSI